MQIWLYILTVKTRCDHSLLHPQGRYIRPPLHNGFYRPQASWGKLNNEITRPWPGKGRKILHLHLARCASSNVCTRQIDRNSSSPCLLSATNNSRWHSQFLSAQKLNEEDFFVREMRRFEPPRRRLRQCREGEIKERETGKLAGRSRPCMPESICFHAEEAREQIYYLLHNIWWDHTTSLQKRQ